MKYLRTYPFKNPDYWVLIGGIANVIKAGNVPLEYGRAAMKEMLPSALRYLNEEPIPPALQKRLMRYLFEVIKA